MNFYYLILALFFLSSSVEAQKKTCTIAVSTKFTSDPEFLLNIQLVKTNNGNSSDVVETKLIKHSITRFTIRDINEPFWALVRIMRGDSTLIMSSAFLITNDDIKISIDSLTANPIIKGGENDFIFKNRLLLFALPYEIGSNPEYPKKNIANLFSFKSSNYRLNFFWNEYESNLIEQVKKHNNLYFVAEQLNKIKSRMPINTVQKCYDLLTDTLKKTNLGISLNRYLNQITRLNSGKPIQEFNVLDSTGTAYKSTEILLRKKYTFFDFWASWCLPCIEAIKEFKKIYPPIDTSLVQMITISIDENTKQWKQSVLKLEMPWMNYIDIVKAKNNVSSIFSLSFIPQNYLVDSNGNIQAINISNQELIGFLKANKPTSK